MLHIKKQNTQFGYILQKVLMTRQTVITEEPLSDLPKTEAGIAEQ